MLFDPGNRDSPEIPIDTKVARLALYGTYQQGPVWVQVFEIRMSWVLPIELHASRLKSRCTMHFRISTPWNSFA